MTSSDRHDNGPVATALSTPPAMQRKARALLAVLVTLTSLAAVLLWQNMQVHPAASSARVLPWLTTALLATNVTWLGLFFWTAVFGWWALRRSPHGHEFGVPLDPSTLMAASRIGCSPDSSSDAAVVAGPTVIVMPIYHEDCAAITERLSWMQADLDAVGAGRHFSWFLLSDSADAEHIAAEAAMLERLRRGRFRGVSLQYRRRIDRTGHKAGNLREFVEERAAPWSFMIVLDADSLMSGWRLLALEADLAARPDTAIIQTSPSFYHSETRWARLLERPAASLGPLLARGATIWQGGEANYWGHNAIVRIAPFRAHATLPVLSGNGPLSGAIRSHDFVEAALLLEAGWACRLDPRSGGSWEQAPPDPLRFLERDRRWMHGNLQHLRLLFGTQRKSMSRLHLLIGATGYLIAPVWLGFILLTVGLQSLQPGDAAIGSVVSMAGGSLLALFATLLIGPRLLSLFGQPGGTVQAFEAHPMPRASEPRPRSRRSCRTAPEHGQLTVATRFATFGHELFWMSLVTPVFMLWHCFQATMILSRGRSHDWGSQQRSANATAFCENLQAQRLVAVLGLALIALVVLTPLSLWVLPLAVSALFAPWVMGWLAIRPQAPRHVPDPDVLRLEPAAERRAQSSSESHGAELGGSVRAMPNQRSPSLSRRRFAVTSVWQGSIGMRRRALRRIRESPLLMCMAAARPHRQ